MTEKAILSFLRSGAGIFKMKMYFRDSDLFTLRELFNFLLTENLHLNLSYGNRHKTSGVR